MHIHGEIGDIPHAPVLKHIHGEIGNIPLYLSIPNE